MTRAEIRKRYNVDSDGIIRSPGKFEGEPLYTPYFWFMALDGGGDEEDGNAILFTIEEEDRDQFPELGTIKKIAVEEDENGFVYSSVIGEGSRSYSSVPGELMMP